MLARVTNYNYRNSFPTCVGNIHLARGMPVTKDFDPRVLEELGKFQRIRIEILEKPKAKATKEPEIEAQEAPEAETPKGPATDLFAFTVKELRAMAAKAGVKRAASLKKGELIKGLEESYGKHTVSEG